MNDTEIKQKALEQLKNDLKSSFGLKGLSKYLKGITVNDVEILPVINAEAKRLSYSGKIFTQRKWDDGTLDKEYLEGDFTLTSDKYYSRKHLKELDDKILTCLTGRVCSTFSLQPDYLYHDKGKVNFAEAGTNQKITESLAKEMEKAYREANSRHLYNFPANVRALVYMTLPTSDCISESYLRPIVAKFSNDNGETLNIVINVFNEEKGGLIFNPKLCTIDNGTYWLPVTPIIYNNQGRFYSCKKNLFGYKII